jgi:hypothetical protein
MGKGEISPARIGAEDSKIPIIAPGSLLAVWRTAVHGERGVASRTIDGGVAGHTRPPPGVLFPVALLTSSGGGQRVLVE